MAVEHNEVVRREFSRQADTFDDDSVFANPRLAAWITANLEPIDAATTLLEVACGAGHMSEYLAPRVRQAIGVDITPAMLANGKQRLDARDVRNVLLQQGDVYELPFVDASFDLVVCRFAVHHFDCQEVAISQMGRVCREGGRVAIIDLVADGARNEAFNDMERRRDPSHTHALAVEELHEHMATAGIDVNHTTDLEINVEVEHWLAQAKTPPDIADAIRAEIQAEVAGGAATGLRASERDGALTFLHHWHIAVGVRYSA
jgi:ubiquinone/menaquinone biosynthesis C-methylase UbiE